MNKRLRKKKSKAKVVGKQVRKCGKGHKWKIVRYSQRPFGSPFTASYIIGSLMCPVCHGVAVSSYNLPARHRS